MALKKKNFSEEEIAIFDDAIIYKRGEFWHFRKYLSGENKYARKSLKTTNRITALEKGRDFYLELIANQKVGKKYFSLTMKEGVEKYLEYKAKDVKAEIIVKGRHTTVKTHLKHWLEYIGKDKKLKELHHSDGLGYYQYRSSKGISGTTIANEQATVNACIGYLFKHNETLVSDLEFSKVKRTYRENDAIRRATFEREEVELLMSRMYAYCFKKRNKLDDKEWLTRQLVRHYIIIASISGLRVGEINQLRWSDVKTFKTITKSHRYAHLAHIDVRKEISKVRKHRDFYCTGGEYFVRLKKILRPQTEDSLIFSTDGGSTQLSKRTLLYHFKRIMTFSGIENAVERKLVPYSLRHYMITQRLMSGLTERQVADMCGTSPKEIERTYYHINEDIKYTNAMAYYDVDDDGFVVPRAI
jgi:integrase